MTIRVSPETGADEALSSIAVHKRFRFGTGGTVANGDIRIADHAELARHFNPFEDWTGLVSIGSEWQRYQPFNASNHAFDENGLRLSAGLDRLRWKGDYRTAYAQLSGKGLVPYEPTPIEDLGLTATDGIERGQLVAVQGRGVYYVSDLGADRQITLAPVASSCNALICTPAKRGLVAFLPGYALRLVRPTKRGDTLIWPEFIPDGLTRGLAVGYATETSNLMRNDDYRIPVIERQAGRLVTQKPMTFKSRPAGSLMLFLPPVTSGQIWSQEGFEIGPDGREAVAFDVHVTLPGGMDTGGIKTVEALEQVPADQPWGAWPALWLFGKNNGNKKNAGDEIDIYEGYWDLYRGPHAYSGNNHGGSENERVFLRDDGDWSRIDANYIRRETSLGGERRFTCIVTRDRIYRFVDGVLVKDDRYVWANERPAQMGINLAVGAFGTSNAGNFLFPHLETNFASLGYGIRSVEIRQS